MHDAVRERSGTSPSVSSFRIAFRKESVHLSTPVLTTLLPEVRVLRIKMLEPLLVVVEAQLLMEVY